MGDIHIALAFDDNFWAPAYATMRSVCMTTRRRTDLVFHLCHLGLSASHCADLDAIATEYGSRVVHHDLSTTDVLSRRLASLPAIKVRRFNNIIYARLCLFDIVPDDVDRILYLDADLLVRVDIAKLHDLDLGDDLAAAVIDPHRTGFQIRRNGLPKQYYDTAEPYFNSGVVLFGPGCRGLDFAAEVARLVPPEELERLYFDQDILNIVLRNRWTVLPGKWNFQNPRAGDERFDPHIVHYSGVRKPWRVRTRIAYKGLYRHTMTNDIFYRYWRHRHLRGVRRLASRLGGGGHD